jgi:hypothetical protein
MDSSIYIETRFRDPTAESLELRFFVNTVFVVPQAASRTFWVASGVLLALAALVSSNYAARGKLVLSAASSTFLFAKLLEDGSAMAVLEQECPAAYPLLCSQLPLLQAHKAAGIADFFLWGGPLRSLGWWKPVEPEASQVVKKVLAQFWRQEMVTSLVNGARQSWRVETGDGLVSDPGVLTTDAIRDLFGESSLPTFRAIPAREGRAAVFVAERHTLGYDRSFIWGPCMGGNFILLDRPESSPHCSFHLGLVGTPWRLGHLRRSMIATRAGWFGWFRCLQRSQYAGWHSKRLQALPDSAMDGSAASVQARRVLLAPAVDMISQR